MVGEVGAHMFLHSPIYLPESKAHTPTPGTQASTHSMKLERAEDQATGHWATGNGTLHQVLPPLFHEGSQPDCQYLRDWDDHILPLAVEEVARWDCPAASSSFIFA